MPDIFEMEQRHRQVAEKIYAAFLLEARVAEISEAEYRYLAVRCAMRLLEGVECSLKPEILRPFSHVDRVRRLLGTMRPGMRSAPTGTVEAVRHAIQTQPLEIDRGKSDG
jgi:hypothetical protein